MRVLNKTVDPNYNVNNHPALYKRIAARGIIMNGDDILLIYTKRYNDYSFPGGGIDAGEDILEGLKRELQEETGAQNISIIEDFGIYEEIRPTYYEGYDFMDMTSYFYKCSADKELGQASPEDYEVNNGSVPVWVNILEAIAHNKKVIAHKEETMGLSIVRETEVLEFVVEDLLKGMS
jgi:ADP-ribose pyrophosphatase YjhB (NUDIX family)